MNAGLKALSPLFGIALLLSACSETDPSKQALGQELPPEFPQDAWLVEIRDHDERACPCTYVAYDPSKPEGERILGETFTGVETNVATMNDHMAVSPDHKYILSRSDESITVHNLMDASLSLEVDLSLIPEEYRSGNKVNIAAAFSPVDAHLLNVAIPREGDSEASVWQYDVENPSAEPEMIQESEPYSNDLDFAFTAAIGEPSGESTYRELQYDRDMRLQTPQGLSGMYGGSQPGVTNDPDMPFFFNQGAEFGSPLFEFEATEDGDTRALKVTYYESGDYDDAGEDLGTGHIEGLPGKKSYVSWARPPLSSYKDSIPEFIEQLNQD